MGSRSIALNGALMDEPSMVRLYMDLTGATESQARNVFMYICSEADEEMDSGEDLGMETPKREQSTWQWAGREAPGSWWGSERALPLKISSPALGT